MAIRVERRLRNTAVLTLLIVALLLPAGVSGQESIVPLQFSFSDPGARSMGFGGAFVALADDATAALANPAGLTQLLRPEISIEARGWNYSTPFTAAGRFEGLPSGFGIDTTVGLRMATSDNDITGLSFLSFVYPKDNWSLAFFRHESANFEFFAETQGLFGGGTDCCQIRAEDQRATNKLDIVSFGISAAYRINDTVDVGFGLTYYDAAFIANATVFAPDDDSLQSIFGPNSYLPERSVFNEKIFLDDSDWALTGGLLWRPSETWSIGAVYRQAPKIEIASVLTAGNVIDFGVPPGDVLAQGTGVLELPELYGLGFAYRAPSGKLTFTFQWDHVTYSNIVESLGIDDRAMDDVDELHLGAEYVFLGSTPIVALRFGTWLEPDHQMRNITDNPFVTALLPRGKDDTHYTIGLGIVTKNVQIDLALDFADLVDSMSLSAIYSF